MSRQIGIDWTITPMTGWGVYGANLAVQLLRQGYVPVFFEPPWMPERLRPEHRAVLMPYFRRQSELRDALADSRGEPFHVEFPVLHSLGNRLKRSSSLNIRGSRDVGVVFFENTEIPAENLEAASSFHAVIAGSTWNGDILRRRGLTNVRVVLQGIDPTLFHPAPHGTRFRDRFVIFSGGKLEYRKGQDIVVAAFREFHARHADALLLTAWHTDYPAAMAGMETVGHVNGLPSVNPATKRLNLSAWVTDNGAPKGAFTDAGLLPNWRMPQVLHEADVALFPNRAEGGTNLVAMETLACGVPAILSSNTGHLDLTALGTCYPLTRQGAVLPTAQYPGVEGWGESDIAEVVGALEEVYRNRNEASRRGALSAEAMGEWTWERQVGRLLQVVVGG